MYLPGVGYGIRLMLHTVTGRVRCIRRAMVAPYVNDLLVLVRICISQIDNEVLAQAVIEYILIFASFAQ